MKVFAFDTTARGCSVAFWESGQRQLSLSEDIERGHSQRLPIMFAELVKLCPLDRIDAIVTNVGPGSFTGIRVGLSFGYGVAQSSSIPFLGATSFDIVLASLSQEPENPYAIVLDAKRRDVYVKLSSEEKPLSLTPEQLKSKIDDEPHRLLGDGVGQVIDELSVHHTVLPLEVSGADAVANAYFQNPKVFADAEPFYLRSADVSQPRTA